MDSNDAPAQSIARDFETSVAIYPPPDNPAVDVLKDAYRQTGNRAALTALEEREGRLRKRLP